MVQTLLGPYLVEPRVRPRARTAAAAPRPMAAVLRAAAVPRVAVRRAASSRRRVRWTQRWPTVAVAPSRRRPRPLPATAAARCRRRRRCQRPRRGERGGRDRQGGRHIAAARRGLATLTVSLLAESAEEVTAGTGGSLAAPARALPDHARAQPKGGARRRRRRRLRRGLRGCTSRAARGGERGWRLHHAQLDWPAYGAAAVATCIQPGHGGRRRRRRRHGGGGLALRQWPAEESLRAMAIVEEWRSQVLGGAE